MKDNGSEIYEKFHDKKELNMLKNSLKENMLPFM